jgi:hypothetical protein
MAKHLNLVVEVHFIPIPANEADDRIRRFRALCLRGVMRYVQQHTDRGEQQDKREATEPMPIDLVQK